MKAAFASFMFLAILASCSSNRDKVVKNGDTLDTLAKTMKDKIIDESVQQHIANWPVDSKTEGLKMIKAYGVPQGVTNEMLVWSNVAPYKATILFKDAIHHKNHADIKEYITKDQTRLCDEMVMKTAEMAD